MKLSTRARYGLRLCFLIGINKDITPLSLLVKQTELSEKYLEKILSKLKSNNIIDAKRGTSGGYFLTRPATEIALGEIFVALEDDFSFAKCVGEGCGDSYCPNKRIFKTIYDKIEGVLNTTSLQDMIDDYKC